MVFNRRIESVGDIMFHGAVASQKANIVTDSLICWLDGNDVINSPLTTTWTDKSENNNNATLSGMAGTDTSGADGSGAVAFDPGDDTGVFGKADQDTDWTIDARICLNAMPGSGVNAHLISSASDSWKFALATPLVYGQVVGITHVGVNDYFSTYKIPLNQIINLVFRRTATAVELIVDGALRYTFALSGVPLPLNKIMGPERGKAKIYRYLAYTKALTNAEIVQNMYAPNDFAVPYNPVSKANAASPLSVTTYDGANQLTHPKALDLGGAWNGYRYWMAYSPYPNDNDDYENPCIAASNDRVTWVTPDGLTNPLDAPSAGDLSAGAYNSDPHLVYRSDLNQLECWWRYKVPSVNQYIIYRRTTTDGVNWNAKETMIPQSASDRMSLSVIHEDGKYKMWYVFGYTESTDGTTWSTPVSCTMTLTDNLTVWHMDIIKTDLGYEGLFCLRVSDAQNTEKLYHSISTDGIAFSNPTLILKPSIWSTWDNRLIYRSTMIKVDGVYYVYYSACNRDRIWKLSLASGTSALNLTGSAQSEYM